MTIRRTLTTVAALVALGAAACTPAANDADTARDTDTTTIIEREVPAAPVVIEREVAVPSPPVVIESDRRDDSTTVRAGRDGIVAQQAHAQAGLPLQPTYEVGVAHRRQFADQRQGIALVHQLIDAQQLRAELAAGVEGAEIGGRKAPRLQQADRQRIAHDQHRGG